MSFLLIATTATCLSAAPEAFTGTYTCTFDGALAGTGIVQVDKDGFLYGVLWSDMYDTGSIEAYVGSYSVSVTGDISGSGTFTIGQNGHITGQLQDNGGSNPDEVYLGLVNSQGDILIVTEEETGVRGQIGSTGSVSGVWKNGTLSGTFSSKDSSGSDGGGGGGCFIDTLEIRQ
jgi:hypothetical protein